jgi:perosamine synthetase
MASSDHLPIPMDRPTFDHEEAEALIACLDPDQFSGTEPIKAFEQSFAAAIGASSAIAVANGTVALHLAMLAAGIGPGDEVIVPALTFIASANAVAYTGATPVFADVDAVTWQMTAEEAARHITRRTRAVLAVHLYGHASDVDALKALTAAHDLILIEDCAEALGTTLRGRHVGLEADVATFSFYKNKTITTGEGGMVITKHPEWHHRMVLLKGQGVPLDRRYWHQVLGYNYRITNLSAAMGNAQLRKLGPILGKKRRLAARYWEAFADLPISLQAEPHDCESSWWLVAGTVDSETTRDGLGAHLQSRYIETRPVFKPLQRFPMYSHLPNGTPNSDEIASRGICFPSWPDLDDARFDRIVREARRYLG